MQQPKAKQITQHIALKRLKGLSNSLSRTGEVMGTGRPGVPEMMVLDTDLGAT